MAKFEIPTKDTKLFLQPNKGDVFGNLFATFNMDFDSVLGKIRVSPRTRINTDSIDDADLGVPWAFLRTSADTTDRWWAGCGAVLFKTAGTNPSATFTQDTAGATDASSPADLTLVSSDAVEFNSNLVVSRPADIARLVAGTWKRTWWTAAVVSGGLAQAALTTGIAHPLHVSTKTNLLLIGDGNLLHTVDKNSNVKNSRVILPTEFEIIWIRSTPDGSWIGARNKINKEAKAYFWDEVAENYNRGYGLKNEITFAGLIKDGVPYTVNGLGQLLKFTGVSFDEVAVFPVFGQINKRFDDGSAIRGNIHRNGMAIIEGKTHINVGSILNATLYKQTAELYFPSGVWTYDEKQGLRHKYSLSLYDGTEIDYGAFALRYAGALAPTTDTQGIFLAGGEIHVDGDAANNIRAIFYRDLTDGINKRGHFITSIFESSGFEDIFKDILLSFKRFLNSGDRIIIKYKEIKNVNYPIYGADMGTWTSTSVFTSTSTGLANALAGDEVLILVGKGGGALAKISTITVNAGTYTVTLAEAITGVSGTMLFIVDNWTECATISTQGIERQGFDLDVVGTWIQLKVELRSAPGGTAGNGSSPELEKIVITSDKEMVE